MSRRYNPKNENHQQTMQKKHIMCEQIKNCDNCILDNRHNGIGCSCSVLISQYFDVAEDLIDRVFKNYTQGECK